MEADRDKSRMGLVGRLEDLPISDILQIVYLSRGTGILQLRLEEGQHTVIFSRGLVVNASAPGAATLHGDLEKRLNLASLGVLAGQKDIPLGLAALEMNLIRPADLETIVSDRVIGIIRKLSSASDGEFEFIAREPTLAEIEYDPRMVFRKGGILPETILGKDSVRLRTLGSVKESLNKAVATQRITMPRAEPALEPPEHFLLFVGNDPEMQHRLLDAGSKRRCALVHAAAGEAMGRVNELVEEKRSFVTILDLETAEPRSGMFTLIREIKARDARTPVIVMDGTPDSEARHLALEAGADLILIKPAQENDAELALFVEDLMLVSSRRFAGRPGPLATVEETAAGEPMHRGFRLLVQLIKEVSDPHDISPVTLTILQLAADYVDRSVLFAIKGDQFVTLGKFGLRIGGGRGLRLCRGELSIIDRVVATGRPYRGMVESPVAEELAATFAGPAVREVVVLPMLSGSEVVGVLYGDNAVHHQPIADTVGLEVFLAQAGVAFHTFLHSSVRALPDDLASGVLQFQ